MKNTPPQSANASRAVLIRDIAEYCQVSVCTVSRALQQDSRVSAETTARILAAAATLGYTPNVAARHLALQRFHRQALSRLIVLSLPLHFYRARYFSDIFRGAMEVADIQDFSLMVATHLGAHTFRADWQGVLQRITRQVVDGLIVYASITEQDFIHQLRAHPGFGQRPIISVMGHHDECASVVADEQAGAYAATRHLLELGHQHVLCFVHSLESLSLHTRLLGVSQALREHGFDPARHLHQVPMPAGWGDPDVPLSGTSGEQIPLSPSTIDFFHYLAAHPEVTAILALNDANARNAWYALHASGVRTPDDISIIGFDDTDPLPDEHGTNLLTSVRLPLVEIGRQATQLLIDQLTGVERATEPIMLPTELVVRSSTAPPRSRGTEGLHRNP